MVKKLMCQRKHASDVGVYMWYIFNTLNESSKYVVTEMETLDKKTG